jgi:hypothetical protein
MDAITTAADQRNMLADMCAHGVVLTDAGHTEQVWREAAASLAAGPPTLSKAETDLRRYALTDVLDDLGDAEDADE